MLEKRMEIVVKYHEHLYSVTLKVDRALADYEKDVWFIDDCKGMDCPDLLEKVWQSDEFYEFVMNKKVKEYDNAY